MEGAVAALNIIADPAKITILKILLLGLLVMYSGSKMQAVCYIVATCGTLHASYKVYRSPNVYTIKSKCTVVVANCATVLLPLIIDIYLYLNVSVNCTQKEKPEGNDCYQGWYYWYWLTKCTIVLSFHLCVDMTNLTAWMTIILRESMRKSNAEERKNEPINVDIESAPSEDESDHLIAETELPYPELSPCDNALIMHMRALNPSPTFVPKNTRFQRTKPSQQASTSSQ